MSEKLNAVVIGGGFAGMLHRDALLADHRVGSLAVIEVNSQRRQELRNLGITTFSNLDSLYQEWGSPNVAILALPPKYNLATVEKLASFDSKPTGVLVDKPLALTVEDARDIERICAKEFAVAMFGLTADFHPELIMAKYRVGGGEIGRVVSYSERIVLGGPGAERYMRQDYGGVISMAGPHGLRHLDNLLGERNWQAKSVVVGNTHWSMESPDWADVVLCDPETSFLTYLSWHIVRNYKPSLRDYQMYLTGTEGTITVTGFDGVELMGKNGSFEEKLHNPETSLRDRHLPGFVAQEKVFLDAVCTGGESPFPLNMGVRIQALMAEIESAANR